MVTRKVLGRLIAGQHRKGHLQWQGAINVLETRANASLADMASTRRGRRAFNQ
jgi:hypothetical protein